MKNHISIVQYSPHYKDAFKKINIEWLTDMFEVEDYDNEVLTRPEQYILNRRGGIWMALLVDDPVGTVALMEIERGMFELTKMGVTRDARGHGVGRKLLEHLIYNIFNTQKNTYFLLTNSQCKAAIHLYEAYGFKHCEETRSKFGNSYKRCDVGMVYTPSNC